MPSLSLSEFKSLVREQFYMLLIDQEACLAALPALVPPDSDMRRKILALIREVLSSRGPLTPKKKTGCAKSLNCLVSTIKRQVSSKWPSLAAPKSKEHASKHHIATDRLIDLQVHLGSAIDGDRTIKISISIQLAIVAATSAWCQIRAADCEG